MLRSVLPPCWGAVRSLCPTQPTLVWPWAGERLMGWDGCMGSQKSQWSLHRLRLCTQGEHLGKRQFQLRYYVSF